MKKLLTMFAAVALVLGMTLSAQAGLITITFDEPGITSGPTNDRYDGTQIDTQYSAIGVTWTDTLPANASLTGQGVTVPSEFNGSWGTETDQMLWYYGTGGGGLTPVDATITLSAPSDYLSFEYRRPNATGTLNVLLYNSSDTLVYSSATLTAGTSWNTFTYTGDDTFNRVNIKFSDKSITDNYSFNMVPIPAAFWLLGSGLLMVIRRRKS